jgi:hypothetical protein
MRHLKYANLLPFTEPSENSEKIRRIAHSSAQDAVDDDEEFDGEERVEISAAVNDDATVML